MGNYTSSLAPKPGQQLVRISPDGCCGGAQCFCGSLRLPYELPGQLLAIGVDDRTWQRAVSLFNDDTNSLQRGDRNLKYAVIGMLIFSIVCVVGMRFQAFIGIGTAVGLLGCLFLSFRRKNFSDLQGPALVHRLNTELLGAIGVTAEWYSQSVHAGRSQTFHYSIGFSSSRGVVYAPGDLGNSPNAPMVASTYPPTHADAHMQQYTAAN
jgi:hypothetical protein